MGHFRINVHLYDIDSSWKVLGIKKRTQIHITFIKKKVKLKE